MKNPRAPVDRRNGGCGAAGERDHSPSNSLLAPSTIAKAAADLAAAGFAAFPCGIDKAPVISTGFKAATTDPDTAYRLFERPGAELIGVATGAPSGVAVLDLDGAAGLSWAEAHAELLPATVVVRTRRGGLHYWYAAPGAPPPSTAGRIAPGVDTRGRGGYAIAWNPAELLGGRAEMAPWPEWLSALLVPAPPPPAPPRHVPLDTAAMRLLARALARVRAASAPADGIPGRRHETLRAAARLIGGVVAIGLVNEIAARRELIAAGIAAGLPHAEVAAVVAWGLADGARHPLTWVEAGR
jgi:hypothetical protein